jgi:uncharacterized protein with HEPN domain
VGILLIGERLHRIGCYTRTKCPGHKYSNFANGRDAYLPWVGGL